MEKRKETLKNIKSFEKRVHLKIKNVWRIFEKQTTFLEKRCYFFVFRKVKGFIKF